MPSPLSTHLPFVSGGLAVVNGEAIIDTGLRELQSFMVSFNETNFAANEESKVSWYEVPGETNITKRVVIRLEKGGSNEGVLGDNDVQVSWLALGI